MSPRHLLLLQREIDRADRETLRGLLYSPSYSVEFRGALDRASISALDQAMNKLPGYYKHKRAVIGARLSELTRLAYTNEPVISKPVISKPAEAASTQAGEANNQTEEK